MSKRLTILSRSRHPVATCAGMHPRVESPRAFTLRDLAEKIFISKSALEGEPNRHTLRKLVHAE